MTQKCPQTKNFNFFEIGINFLFHKKPVVFVNFNALFSSWHPTCNIIDRKQWRQSVVARLRKLLPHLHQHWSACQVQFRSESFLCQVGEFLVSRANLHFLKLPSVMSLKLKQNVFKAEKQNSTEIFLRFFRMTDGSSNYFVVWGRVEHYFGDIKMSCDIRNQRRSYQISVF